MYVRQQWNLSGIAWMERIGNVKSDEIHQMERFKYGELVSFWLHSHSENCSLLFNLIVRSQRRFISFHSRITSSQVKMKLNSNWNLFTTSARSIVAMNSLTAHATTTNTHASKHSTALVGKMKTSNRQILGQCVPHTRTDTSVADICAAHRCTAHVVAAERPDTNYYEFDYMDAATTFR